MEVTESVSPPTHPDAAVAVSPLMNSRELAALLKVGDTTVEGMAARGEIPSVRIGKALRFEVDAVLAALKGAR